MNYPLFLSYHCAIIGNGFVADVRANGRLLATVEPDGTWLYGVNPGAIAADGDNLDDAHIALREMLRLTLVDFAQEAKSFEDFQDEVVRFFQQTDAHTTAAWNAAVEVVRASKTKLGDLPPQPAETPVAISVTLKTGKELTAAMNVPARNLPVCPPGQQEQPPLGLAA